MRGNEPLPREGIDRRRFIGRLLAAGAAGVIGPAITSAAPAPIHRRAIPASGELLPVVGMGSYVTFNVHQDPALLSRRLEVLRAFFDDGGGLVDSSPMYGSSEAAIGHCLAELGHPPGLFSATKVWTWRGGEGEVQMRTSRDLWGLPRFDLMQVHNLLNWEDHLQTIHRDREAGRVRYIGVTTSHGRRHEELERLMRTIPLDFVQLTYNMLDREAEDRLLPLAADRGIAVIVNRPFRRKDLIRQFARYPLPAWAAEIDCRSWAQFLLKFVVSHPAVTCAIPATSQVEHMHENMAVMRGPLPDPTIRDRMIAYVQGL